MGTPTTIVGGSMWIIWWASELLTKWAPATLISLLSPVMPGAAISQVGTINGPVTTEQLTQYLHIVSIPGTYAALYHAWSIYLAIALAWTLLFGTFIIYCATRFLQIRRMEYMRFAALANPVAAHDAPQTQLRWKHILGELRNGSEQGRRNAILEADVLLRQLLNTQGLSGNTMIDQLKGAKKEKFRTIDAAWEAHHLRLRLTEHATEKLTPADARHCIELYAQVFREFKYIQ